MYCPLLGGIQEEYREGHQHVGRQADSHQGGQQRHRQHSIMVPWCLESN